MVIETSGMVVLLHCQPALHGCFVEDFEEATQHARERAAVTGMRQRVTQERITGAWLTVTTGVPIEPATWTFDGKVYKIQ